MTSESTMDRTQSYFRENNYFGLSEENVKFFEQFTLPCTDFEGKILLAEKHKIATAPGNFVYKKNKSLFHLSNFSKSNWFFNRTSICLIRSDISELFGYYIQEMTCLREEKNLYHLCV